MTSSTRIESGDPAKHLLHGWGGAGGFAAAFLFCAWAGSFLSPPRSPHITFWLPSGLYLAALLLTPLAFWHRMILAAFAANLAFDLMLGTPLSVILGFFSANTVQACLGAALVRWRGGEGTRVIHSLAGFLLLMALGGVLSPVAGASLGAATLVLSGLSPSFLTSWKTWWGGNSLGILILTPTLLAWLSSDARRYHSGVTRARALEGAGLAAGFTVVLFLLFSHGWESTSRELHLLSPFMLAAGLRLGVRGATAASVLMSVSTTFLAVHLPEGGLPATAFSAQDVFTLQTFLAIGSIVGLIPALVLEERDQFLSSLAESESRYRTVVECSPEAVVISVDDRITYANPACLRMMQVGNLSQIVGRSVYQFVPESDHAVMRERRRQVLELGVVLPPLETVAMKPDGGVLHMEAVAAPFLFDGRPAILNLIRDVTARRESQRMLTTLISNLPGMVYRCRNDPEWTMDFVSEGCRELTGHGPEDFLGSRRVSFARLMHPDDASRVWQTVQEAVRVRRPYEITYRIRAAHAGQRWVWERGQGVFDGEGGLLALEGFISDITAQHEAEVQRLQALAREKASRDQFTRRLILSQEAERRRIAGELHDGLGQNLLLIKNRAQMGLNVPGLPDGARAQLGAISEVSDAAIREVRTVSHDLRPYQLDQLGLNRALQSMLEQAAGSSPMRLTWKLDAVDDVLPLDAATSVYRIVQEALNNILKHSAARTSRVELERDIREGRLVIEDDGRGFEGGDGDGDGDRGGMGLRNISERVGMLGGVLKVQSSESRGTRIEVVFPIRE